jgi:hypothetical protein
MKKILSIFVVLMYMLSGIAVAYAQDTAESGITAEVTAETTEEATVSEETAVEVATTSEPAVEEAAPEAVTTSETVEVTQTDAELADDSAITAVVGETETTSEETVEISGGEDYTAVDQVVDRVALAFTFQVERRVALMAKIAERRQAHYDFLVAKGKTKQAEKFKGKTIGLVKNFDQWKAKKESARAEKPANRSVAKTEVKEQRAEKVKAVKETVKERVKEKSRQKSGAAEETE